MADHGAQVWRQKYSPLGGAPPLLSLHWHPSPWETQGLCWKNWVLQRQQGSAASFPLVATQSTAARDPSGAKSMFSLIYRKNQTETPLKRLPGWPLTWNVVHKFFSHHLLLPSVTSHSRTVVRAAVSQLGKTKTALFCPPPYLLRHKLSIVLWNALVCVQRAST